MAESCSDSKLGDCLEQQLRSALQLGLTPFLFPGLIRSFSLTLGSNLVSLLWQTLQFGFSTVQTVVEEVDEKRDEDFQGNPV